MSKIVAFFRLLELKGQIYRLLTDGHCVRWRNLDYSGLQILAPIKMYVNFNCKTVFSDHHLLLSISIRIMK